MLKAEHLPAAAAFVEVARHGNFSRAAVVLGISTSALSQTVRNLEARLGTRLLNRTTRRVSVTEAGALFLERVTPALEQFQSAVDALDDLRDRPAGVLRISLSRQSLTSIVAPLLDEFVARYPQVTLDLVADDRFVDLVGEGFDAGLRLGERLAPNMIAVPVTRAQRMSVVGAPRYFDSHAVPQKPEDLLQHRCLRFRFSTGAIYRWEFCADGKDFDMEVSGPLVCNDNLLLLQAARRGVGLAHLMENLVQDDLDNGSLRRVLENWCPSFPGFYLYYPSRAHLPLKLRALIDFMATRTRM